MKPSRFLRKVGLYRPAKRLLDSLQSLGISIGLRLKRGIHGCAVRRARKNGRFGGFGPKVLIVMNSGGIGNSVEATPLVQAARALWPRGEITIVVPSGDLFDDWCVPDYITDVPDDVRGRAFDHTFFPYALYNNIPRWQETCRLGEVHCTRVRLRKYFLKPEREYMLDMARRLGYRGPAPPLYVSLKRPSIDIADMALRICLVPGAKNEPMWRHKRWPYYGELAEVMLTEYPDAQVCIVGTKDDPFCTESGAEARIIDLRGRLSLAETAWLLRGARLAVGNDCGPMHIAYAVQTPSIVIFGPTCQIKNAPLNKAVALSLDLPCRPCQYSDLLERCPDPCCMRELKPQLVMKKAEQILSLRDRE